MESFIKFPQQFFDTIPKHNSSLDQFDNTLQLLKYLLRLSIYFNEVEILISTNDWLRARKTLDKSEEQLKKSKHFLVYLPRIKKLSAWVHNVKSEFAESESELNLGLIIAKELKDKKTYSELLLHLGNCYFYQTKYDMALDCYNRANKITLKTKKDNPDDLENLKVHASILNNIGMIYQNKNDLQNALEFLNKSVEINSQISNKDKNIGVVFLNISEILLNQKNYTSSLQYLKKAIKIFNRYNDKLWQAEALLRRGKIYLARNKFSKALTFIKDAIKIKTKVNDNLGVIKGYNILGDLYLKQDLNRKAIRSFTKALETAQLIHHEFYIKKFQEKLETL